MFRRALLSAAALAATLSLAPLAAQAAQPLKLEVYNPGTQSMFPVSSEIVTGQTDAVLIDAQFQRNDAEALVQKIKATGKKLTTVYISHSDPDYYFGLDVIQAAFPDAKIVATPQTVAAIQASRTASWPTGARSSRTTRPRRWSCPRRWPATASRSKAARSRSWAWTAPRPRAPSRGSRR